MANHTIIKLRRGTAAEWAASEPQPNGEVLKLGEPGFEKDTRKLKIGDGTTPWNSLDYIAINEEDLQDLLGNEFFVAGSNIEINYNDEDNNLTISTSGSPIFNQITISSGSGISYYVMANVDGNTVTSLDGLNWNGPYDLNIETDHVATNGTTIVAIDDDEIGYTSFSSPSEVTAITATVSGITNIDLNQIIYGGGYFVVAGQGDDGVKIVPLYGYSSDGSNWTFKIVTGELADTLADNNDGDSVFNDIDYNGVGWNFSVISGNEESEEGIGGGVYTTDITETFDDSNYFSMVPGTQAAWNGNAWYYINSEQGSGFNVSSDPRQGEWDGPYNPWESSQEDLGIIITNDISDTFCGGNGYLAFSDGDGHISFSNDNGQTWTYITPIPYTATITDISYVDNKYQISVTGEHTDHADGEKITISGSSVTGYNGVYFLDDSNFLYTDFELTTPWTAEIAEFSGTANLTWSNGQYIDAMDYVNGYFYIGNDDEQIARSDDLINWTIVDDRNDAFMFWNDFSGYSSGEGGGDGSIQNSAGNINITTNNNTNIWAFSKDGDLIFPSGSIISETNNTVSIAPPTAVSGQSLVIRPTSAIWAISSSNYIEYGNPITIVVTLQTWAYFGTVNYTISGTGVTEQSLGRALTGKLTFVSTTGPEPESITWTIPANSDITEFTLTLTSVDGTRSTDQETENDPALYYNFEENAMPIGQYVTVTNNDMSNSEHSHVHLVAGDPETVDIYLGDDDQYVKIEKDGGDVIIGTNNNTHNWTFGTDGNFILPESGNITFGDGTNQDTAASGLITDAFNASLVAGSGISLDYDSGNDTLTISSSGTGGGGTTINNYADNRILTSDGTSTGINGENNLTFNGSLLSVSGNLVANTGTINSLNFNNIGDPDLSIRQLAWNNSEGSLAVGLSDTYEMFLGGELHYRVRNNTGSSILAGTAVYATGLTPGGNNRIEIAPKAADGSIREVRFMGLVTENIDNGVNGFTTHFGYIRNIDTRGDYAANGATDKVWASGEPTWAEGDLLYVHPTVAGKLTKIEPKHSISVAIILNRHQNQGKLFVRPTSYGHLNDNHDVAVSGATNGQFLQYDSATDYWVPSSSGSFTILDVDNLRLDGNTISSTNSNGNIVLAPSGTGDVQVDADTLRVGDSNAAATITTNGTGNLTISTNSGTNAGTIVLNQGTNGNIAITPNGSGEVDLSKVDIDGGSIDNTIIGATTASTGKFKQLYPTVISNGAVSGSVGTDVSTGQIFDMTLGGTTTLSNPTNPVDGVTVRWRIAQDGTGGHTVNLDTKFQIPSSASSPLPWSTAANAMDVLAATYHSGRDKWDIVAFVPGY